MEMRERNTLAYNNPPPSNQESPLLHLHQDKHHHGFQLLKQQVEPQIPRTNPNPDPPPAPLVSQTPSQPPTAARPTAAVVVRYRECLKNHAANMGAHVLDGCGEFMPGGEVDTPEELKCAACECHRSFHRKEVEGESQSGYYTHHMASRIPLSHNPPPRAAAVQLPLAPSPQQRPHRYDHHPMPPIMMAFGGASGTPAESSSEDLNIFRNGVQLMAQTSKKRFRTKFTEEQKDKMHELAERIGWKIQKQDEQEVLQFCNEFGLTRQVFKVWMHNNKQATKKKQL